MSETVFVQVRGLNVRTVPSTEANRPVGSLSLNNSVIVSDDPIIETVNRIWRQIVEGAFKDKYVCEIFDGEVLLANEMPNRGTRRARRTTRQPRAGNLNSLFDPKDLGLHSNAGGWAPEQAEIDAYEKNKIKIAFINADQENVAGEVVSRLRAAGVKDFAVRAASSGANVTADASKFVAATAPKLEQYRNAIGADQFFVQIHNEPNLFKEGWTTAWQNGSEFAAWFKDVAKQYREMFPGIQIGFSPMSPGDGHAERMAEAKFMDGALSAIAVSDWVAIHAYWLNGDTADDLVIPVSAWQRWFKKKPLMATELGPVDRIPVTAQAVRNAHARFQAAGVSVCMWLAHDNFEDHPHAGQVAPPWLNSSWTFQNLRL